MFHNARGSVWRRWDLHVHTPRSTSADFGDPEDPETWQRFGRELLAVARRHQIAAICLADYFTLDGGIGHPRALRGQNPSRD